MPDPSNHSGSPRPFDDAQGRPELLEKRAESGSDWKSHIRARLVPLRLSPVREREIVEELAQHLEDRCQELMAKGATPDNAARTARTEFDAARLQALLGNLRQAHWHELPPPGPSRAFLLDSALIDLRHAFRALKATPSFTIGIRMALGATRTRVMTGVFGHVGRLVAAGLIAGGFVAWSLSSAASRFLFGLDSTDPRAYAVAMVTLLAAAFVATLLPARRAASVDPTRALQQE